MTGKYRQLAQNTFIFAMGAFGSKLFLFLLVPLYTNVLTTREYGISELIINIGKLILPVVSLTIYDAIFPFALSNKYKKENIFLNVNLVLLAAAVFLIIITPFWSYYKPVSEWKWYLYGYIISSFVLENNMLYLKVNEKNRLYSILCVIQSFLLLIFNYYYLIVAKAGIKGYVISLIASNVIISVTAVLTGKFIQDLIKSRFDKKLLAEMIKYSSPLIISSVLWWVIHSSDKIMVERMLGGADLGLYSTAAKIPALIGTVTSIFNQAWGFSTVKEYNSSNDSKFYSNVFQNFYIFLFGAGMFITALAKPFMSIYVGDGFSKSWLFVPMLVLGSVYSSFAVFINSLFSAMKRSTDIMWSTLFAGIINIIANYILIPIVGLQGATIGTFAAYVSLTVIVMINLRRYIAIDYKVRTFLLAAAVSFLQCAVVIKLSDSFIPSVPFLVIYCFICRRSIYNLLKAI